MRGLRPARAGRDADRKGPEAAQLDAPAFDHRLGDAIEDDADDALDVFLREVRIFLRELCDQLRLDHSKAPRFPGDDHRSRRPEVSKRLLRD